MGSSYNYSIHSLKLKSGTVFRPQKINVFVGPNNCGKTRLLKDILSYITGEEGKTLILDELDISYPDTWEEMESIYDMHIVDSTGGTKQLKHISPMLDTAPSGLTSGPSLENSIRSWLKNDKRRFRAATGAGFVTYLNTDNRLRMAMRQPVQENLQDRGPQNVLEALYMSDITSFEKAKNCINEIFEKDIFLSPYNVGTLEYRIGTNFPSFFNNPMEAYKQLSSYPLLDSQGDGIRSVLGIVSAIVSVKKPVILIDEPEAFLHPPQALQLGEIITKLVDASQQVFIATHSADFLRGLLSSTRDAVITHLNRTEDITEASILDPDTLNQIVTDPLLSSSRVLEGMFYKGVVATEADADTVFYQRLFQKVGAADGVHFVNAHNKQTLKKIIDPYQKLGIKFAMIADADVIRDKHEFTEILQVTSDEQLKSQILKDRETILCHFQNRNKYEILRNLQAETRKLTEQITISETDDPNKIANELYEFRLSLKRLRDDSDELSEFKKEGRNSLPVETQRVFDNLWNNCASVGLFIVKVGELESWMVDYGIERTSNKSKWISKALDKVFHLKYDPNIAIWQFVEALRRFLVS